LEKELMYSTHVDEVRLGWAGQDRRPAKIIKRV
jgi:hypothetical protein